MLMLTGKYDGMIHAAAAMRSVATITVATCYVQFIPPDPTGSNCRVARVRRYEFDIRSTLQMTLLLTTDWYRHMYTTYPVACNIFRLYFTR